VCIPGSLSVQGRTPRSHSETPAKVVLLGRDAVSGGTGPDTLHTTTGLKGIA